MFLVFPSFERPDKIYKSLRLMQDTVLLCNQNTNNNKEKIVCIMWDF